MTEQIDLPTDKVAKLPKWARESIKDMERLIARQQEEILMLRKEQTESPLTYQDYPHEPIFLPKYVTIRFAIPSKIKNAIEAKFRYEKPELVNISSDHGTLIVRPSASNSIDVGVLGWQSS